MSNYKASSTRDGSWTDVASRLTSSPFIQPDALEPSAPDAKVVGVLNPAHFCYDGREYLLFRVDEQPRSSSGAFDPNVTLAAEEAAPGSAVKPYCSHLRLAEVSHDLSLSHVHILRSPGGEVLYHVEDPHVTPLSDRLVMTFNMIDHTGSTGWLADLVLPNSCCAPHRILGPDHKHTVVIPAPGRQVYYALTRPLGRIALHSSGVWMLQSPDLTHWGVPTSLILPRSGSWDSERTGACGPPMRLADKWLLLYFGVDDDNSYHVGAVCLAAANPRKVLSRSSYPLLSPTLSWERHGRRADTIFADGGDLVEARVRIFYGAADTCIGVAEVAVDDVLDSLEAVS